jgi:Homeodomain-like domain-containing protein
MVDQDPIAERKAAKLAHRQGLETLALEYGKKQAEHLDELRSIRQFIVEELLPKSAAAGIPFERVAELLGVSRQTIYRWRQAPPR